MWTSHKGQEIRCQQSRERTHEMAKTKDVREAVESEISFDPLVDAINITVKNINGEVALNGTVPSYPQYVEAATVVDGGARLSEKPQRVLLAQHHSRYP